MPKIYTSNDRNMGDRQIRTFVGLDKKELSEMVIEFKNGLSPRPVLKKTMAEFISSDEARVELAQAVNLNFTLGMEEVAEIWRPLYTVIEDESLPETITDLEFLNGEGYFLEVKEGEELTLGSVVTEEGPTLSIKKYKYAMQFSEEMVAYNQTFKINAVPRDSGRKYRMLLNHLHFTPIISYNYTADNQTAAKYVKGDGTVGSDSAYAYEPSLIETIVQGIEDAATAGRPVDTILCHSAQLTRISKAVEASPALSGIANIIAYDGYTFNVGKRAMSYAGVTSGKCYLIRSRQGFRDYTKYVLRTYEGDAVKNAGIEATMISDTWRGVYAAVANNVQEVTLPARPA